MPAERSNVRGRVDQFSPTLGQVFSLPLEGYDAFMERLQGRDPFPSNQPQETIGTYSPPPNMAGAFSGGEQLSPKVVQTIIAESLGEGPEGMRLVAETIMNRARERGITPEQVVMEEGQYAGRNARLDNPENIAAATKAWGIAQGPEDPTMGAEYFYSGDTQPTAAEGLQVVYTHGNHKFLADTSTVREMQQNLADARLYQGAIDGDFGPATKAAAEAFRAQQGVTDPAQALAALGVEPDAPAEVQQAVFAAPAATAGNQAIDSVFGDPEAMLVSDVQGNPTSEDIRAVAEGQMERWIAEQMAKQAPSPSYGPDLSGMSERMRGAIRGGPDEPAVGADIMRREAERLAGHTPLYGGQEVVDAAQAGAAPAPVPPPASQAGVDATGAPLPYAGDYNDILYAANAPAPAALADEMAARQPPGRDRSDLTQAGPRYDPLNPVSAATPPPMAGDPYADFETTRANVRSPQTLRDMMGQAGLDDSQWAATDLGIPSQSVPPSNLPPLLQQQYEQEARRDWARPQAPAPAPITPQSPLGDPRLEQMLEQQGRTFAPYNAPAEAATAAEVRERLAAANSARLLRDEREMASIARTQPIGPPESRNYRIGEGEGLMPPPVQSIALGGPDAPPTMGSIQQSVDPQAIGEMPAGSLVGLNDPQVANLGATGVMPGITAVPQPTPVADIGLTAMPPMPQMSWSDLVSTGGLTPQQITEIQQRQANPPPPSPVTPIYHPPQATAAPTPQAAVTAPAAAGSVVAPAVTAAPGAISGVTRDLSAQNPYTQAGHGALQSVAGLVIHHTGPASSAEGVLETLKQRQLSYNYLVDRDGSIISLLPDGQRGAHVKGPDNEHATKLLKELGLSNSNTVGISLIADDDADVTPEQVAAVQNFANQNWPGVPVYGHGELNDDKQEREGLLAVEAIRAAPTAAQNAAASQTDTSTQTMLSDVEGIDEDTRTTLTNAAAAAQAAGVTNLDYTPEGGLVGYQQDGSPWTPEQQAAAAAAGGPRLAVQPGQTALSIAPAGQAATATPATPAAPVSTMRDVAMAARDAGVHHISVDPVTNVMTGVNNNKQPWTAAQQAQIAAAVPGITVDAAGGMRITPAPTTGLQDYDPATKPGVTTGSTDVMAKPGAGMPTPTAEAAVPIATEMPEAPDMAPAPAATAATALQTGGTGVTEGAAGLPNTGPTAAPGSLEAIAEGAAELPMAPNMVGGPEGAVGLPNTGPTALPATVQGLQEALSGPTQLSPSGLPETQPGAITTPAATATPPVVGATAPAPGTEPRVQLTAPATPQYNVMPGVSTDIGPPGQENLGVIDTGPPTGPAPPVMTGKEKDDYLGPTQRVVTTATISPADAALPAPEAAPVAGEFVPNAPATGPIMITPRGTPAPAYPTAPAPAPVEQPPAQLPVNPYVTPSVAIPAAPPMAPAVTPQEQPSFQQRVEQAGGRSKTFSDPIEYAARTATDADGKFDHDKFWDGLKDVDLTQTQQTVAAKTAAQGAFIQNTPNFLSGLTGIGGALGNINMPDMPNMANVVNPVQGISNLFGSLFGSGFDPRSSGIGSDYAASQGANYNTFGQQGPPGSSGNYGGSYSGPGSGSYGGGGMGGSQYGGGYGGGGGLFGGGSYGGAGGQNISQGIGGAFRNR